MAKKDIAVTISAADRLLETTTNPLHRQILENYRRHAILEVCGEWKDIFLPEMTVEYPLYYFNVTGFAGNKAEGPEEVQAIYRMLAETGAGVQVVEDERLMVSDWGFASEATFNSYYRGSTLIDVGVPVDDPDGYFIMRQKYVMLWPYDERGRMIGEQVYENKAFYELIQIPQDDFLTIADARARLMPMLRPLPLFDPESAVAHTSQHGFVDINWIVDSPFESLPVGDPSTLALSIDGLDSLTCGQLRELRNRYVHLLQEAGVKARSGWRSLNR